MKFRHILPFSLILVLALALVSCASAPDTAPSPSPGPQAAVQPSPAMAPAESPAPQASSTATASPSPTPAAASAPSPAPVARKEIRPAVKQLLVSYADGIPSGMNEYKYDAQGRMVSDTEKNGSDIQVSQRLYSYKDESNLEINLFDGNQKLKSKTRQIFAKGQLIREEVLNDRDELQAASDYKYNEAGQKIEWVIQGKGTPRTASQYTWANGRLVNITVYDATNTPVKSYKRSYSADGNIITEEELDAKQALIRKTVSTWSAGKLVKEEVRSAQDAVQKTSVHSYDNRGLLTRTELFNRKGELIEIQTRSWMDLEITAPNK